MTNSTSTGKTIDHTKFALSIQCNAHARDSIEKLLGPATATVENGGLFDQRSYLHYRLKTPAVSQDDLKNLELARALVAGIDGVFDELPPAHHDPKICRIVGQNPDAEIDLAATLEMLRRRCGNGNGGASAIEDEEPGETPPATTNGSGRPTALKPRFESIPHELKEIPNWVMWKYEPPKKPDGKWRKVPYQVNGYKANTTNRRTWSPFETCRAVYELGGYDGIGFVFDGEVGPDGTCLVGIDLDRCIDNGNIQHFALERIKRLDTYTEASPSGTGLHMIARTEPVKSIKTREVEIYTTARYFTFTGRKWDEDSPIRVATAEVRALIAELKAKQAAERQNKPATRRRAIRRRHQSRRGVQAPRPSSPGRGVSRNTGIDGLTPEQKDEVVDYALEVIASKTPLLRDTGGRRRQRPMVPIGNRGRTVRCSERRRHLRQTCIKSEERGPRGRACGRNSHTAKSHHPDPGNHRRHPAGAGAGAWCRFRAVAVPATRFTGSTGAQGQADRREHQDRRRRHRATAAANHDAEGDAREAGVCRQHRRCGG